MQVKSPSEEMLYLQESITEELVVKSECSFPVSCTKLSWRIARPLNLYERMLSLLSSGCMDCDLQGCLQDVPCAYVV